MLCVEVRVRVGPKAAPLLMRSSWMDLYQTRGCLVSAIVHEKARHKAGPYGSNAGQKQRFYGLGSAVVWIVISTLSETRRRKLLGFFMPHWA
jgi:hypothetical protein